MVRVRVKAPSTRKDVEALPRTRLIDLAWKLTKVVKALQHELDSLRNGDQSGTTWSKPRKKSRKKKPGRKKGKGRFSYRKPPDPNDVTDHIDVSAPDSCPGCGAQDLELDHYEDAWTTDIPGPMPKPQVKHFRNPVCTCKKCGKANIRGKHPELAPDQRGATAHRLGPNVMAAAHTMHYGYGVTVRKTVPIIKDLTGISLTQSAITQSAIRQAKGDLKPKYEALRTSVKESPVAHTDDTGMKMGGKPAHLMGFATPDTEDGPGVSVYQTREQHRNEEVREVIPSDYQGTMVTDRGRSYDAKEFESVKQQKCISHVLKSISEVVETKVGAARAFGERLTTSLRRGLRLWHSYHEGRQKGFDSRVSNVEAEVTRELRDRKLTDPDNQRLLNELGRHHDRGNLLRFLNDPAVPPTNNLEERELKVPIQARKVSQGVKNDNGAQALDVHTSIIRTEHRKQPDSLIRAVADIYTDHQPQPP